MLKVNKLYTTRNPAFSQLEIGDCFEFDGCWCRKTTENTYYRFCTNELRVVEALGMAVTPVTLKIELDVDSTAMCESTGPR